jgi:hypothetical protein
MTWVANRRRAHAMKKYAAPLTLGLACIAYAFVVVCAFYFAAQAQGATDALYRLPYAKSRYAQSKERSTETYIRCADTPGQ